MSQVETEIDFMINFVKRFHNLFKGSLFPSVYEIGGKRISPDIDLLAIDLRQRRARGYEFKYLSYETIDANYKAIYQGIGESLLYLDHGLDQTFLVLGISKDIPEGTSKGTISKIVQVRSFLDTLINDYNFDCFGFYVWEVQKTILSDILEADGFYRLEGMQQRLRKQEILQGKFKFQKEIQKALS